MFTPNFHSYNSQIFSNIIDYQEYYFLKENNIYKIILTKNEKDIFIKIKNYMISFNQIQLSRLLKIEFNSINEAYQFLLNKFEENKIIIKNIILNKEMKIKIINENEKEIELTLIYNNKNYDIIINEIKKLKNEILKLKEENNILKNEINKLKKYHDKNNNIKDIKLLPDIVNDSFGGSDVGDTFTVFKSINNKLYLIYTNEDISIVCYDLNKQKIINEVKNCHNECITNFRHYLHEKNKEDLIMSVSAKDNNLKLWSVNNWECILNINKVNNYGYLFSSCFLKEDNIIYIITCNLNKNGKSESMKVFDFNGKKLKEIKYSNEKTYFINTYYDNKLSKNYIITGNKGYIKSYDFKKNELYYKYSDKNNNDNHLSIITKENEGIIKLIESCNDGIIRIWNFHSGVLLNKFKISNEQLRGICPWNDNYLFVGCIDKTIKLVELNNGLIIKNLFGHEDKVITIKKIITSKYGECLISQNLRKSKIIMWRIN